MSKFTAKQQAFINAYLGEAEFNGVKAAELAGYSGSYFVLAATASKLLKKGKVADFIADHFRSNTMSSEEVLERMSTIARFDPGKATVVDEETKELSISWEKLVELKLTHLVKAIIPTAYGEKIIFRDADKMLELLGKAHGHFDKKPETEVTVNVDIAFEKALDQVYSSDNNSKEEDD